MQTLPKPSLNPHPNHNPSCNTKHNHNIHFNFQPIPNSMINTATIL